MTVKDDKEKQKAREPDSGRIRQTTVPVDADGSALSLKPGRAGAPYKYLEQSYRWASKHPWVWEQRVAGKLNAGERRLFVNLLVFGKEKLPVGEIREKGRGWTVGGLRVALSGGRVVVVTADGRTLRLK